MIKPFHFFGFYNLLTLYFLQADNPVKIKGLKKCFFHTKMRISRGKGTELFTTTKNLKIDIYRYFSMKALFVDFHRRY